MLLKIVYIFKSVNYENIQSNLNLALVVFLVFLILLFIKRKKFLNIFKNFGKKFLKYFNTSSLFFKKSRVLYIF